jgi:hypothetical protein
MPPPCAYRVQVGSLIECLCDGMSSYLIPQQAVLPITPKAANGEHQPRDLTCSLKLWERARDTQCYSWLLDDKCYSRPKARCTPGRSGPPGVRFEAGSSADGWAGVEMRCRVSREQACQECLSKTVVENITGLTACCKMGLEEEQGINNLSQSWDGA